MAIIYQIFNFFIGARFANITFETAIIALLAFNVLLILALFLLRRKNTFSPSRPISFFLFLKRHALLLEIILFLLFLLTLADIIIPAPRVSSPSKPSFGTTVVDNTNPLVVEFDRPINPYKTKINVAPELKGSWHYESGRYLFFLKQKLIFTPEETLPVDTDYYVTLQNMSSTIGLFAKDFLFTFHTPPAPKVIKIEPRDKADNVDINQSIAVTLDFSDSFRADWQFTLSPDTPVKVASSQQGKVYTIKPESPLSKGVTYTLTAYRIPLTYNFSLNKVIKRAEKVQSFSAAFTTIPSPSVKSVTPTGSGILVDTPVKIEFRQDMDRQSVEKAFSFSPKVNGTFSWSGNNILTFKPGENLQKNTKYTITIDKGATTLYGTALDNNFSSSFTTIGNVQVSSFNPANGVSNVALNQIVQVNFNQAVDHASAESKFSLSPNVTGTFSWNGNSLKYSHSDFGYSQSYTVTVASGVKTVNGLDSNQPFSAKFTTRSQSVTLNVPSYKQAHMYSCYATAAKSALAFKGVNVSEDAILGRIGYDPTPWSGTWNQAGSTWGDPDEATVGSVDGKADNIGWGYGAHWGPTARAISSFGRGAEVKSGWSVQGIAQELAAGNPVIVWWVNGVWPAYEVTWYKNGKRIRAVNSMHVQVVKGFTGTVDNPTSFAVTDSGYGYPGRTLDTASFQAKWRWFNNTAVVVK